MTPRRASAAPADVTQGDPAGQARAQGAGRPRGVAAAGLAEEHAAAARLHVLRTRLRRQHVPRLHREDRQDRHHHAPALRPQHDGGRRRRRDEVVESQQPPACQAWRESGRGARRRAAGRASAAAPRPVRDPEQIQQMVEQTQDVFGRAAQPPRWPMYVRQFKQFLRGVDATFDERKWGLRPSWSSCAMPARRAVPPRARSPRPGSRVCRVRVAGYVADVGSTFATAAGSRVRERGR